ncbi:DNA adenine methylase [Desulfofalx alkaliphila]|uniref:DNA adenine methylase n=1 Tax=Desulfofalx alkaliphila TaxID=105483 RepID=UPI00068B9AC4|nr:DNA adenine methylase [Desulfofalx alkaliphila]
MIDGRVQAKPFVKWAGGKRQLLSTFVELYPNKLKKGKIKKYIEPFVGGGAVFFDLASRYEFEEIILNDINTILISTYFVIKTDVKKLIEELEKLQKSYLEKDTREKEKLFYHIRSRFNELKRSIEFNGEGTAITQTLVMTCSDCHFLDKVWITIPLRKLFYFGQKNLRNSGGLDVIGGNV